MNTQAEPDKITIRINGRLLLAWLKIGVTIIVLFLLYRGGRGLYRAHVSSETESLLQAGYPALALEEIDPHRSSFVDDAEGCRVILSAYIEAKKYERLEWAFESCRKNGIGTYEVSFARAELLLHNGSRDEAIARIRDLKDFHRPTTYLFLVDLLMTSHREQEACQEIDEAIKNFPEHEGLRILGLRVFVSQHRWADAIRVAGPIKDAALAGQLRPDLRRLIATAYENSGDKNTANAIMSAQPARQGPPPDAPKSSSAAPPAGNH